MWQLLLDCMSARNVAVCIPSGGEAVPLIYWYGILASLGIFLGAFYASKHLEAEGEDPDLIWDALLWVLIPALVGARLWYVAQAALGGSTYYSFSRPLEIINPRTGGMNIFGGAIGGLIAIIVYVKVKKLNGWLLTDGALMGLLVGQGIGRIGNFINIELYGPPTNSSWFGMLVPEANRLPDYTSMTLYPPETRFHPTMFYEAFWLLASFGVLYFLFRRYQEWFIHGTLTGIYLITAGVGRFIIETWRPDQPAPLLTDGTRSFFSYSRMLSILYVVVGAVILLDRLGYLKIPLIPRPETRRQRERAYQNILSMRRRKERAKERERQRAQRRKEREAAEAAAGNEDTGT